MNIILPCACGVDVHEGMIEACILSVTNDSVTAIRKQFSTFPEQLSQFVNWLYENDCYHITAVSRKILKLIFKLLSDNITYDNTVAMSNIKD